MSSPPHPSPHPLTPPSTKPWAIADSVRVIPAHRLLHPLPSLPPLPPPLNLLFDEPTPTLSPTPHTDVGHRRVFARHPRSRPNRLLHPLRPPPPSSHSLASQIAPPPSPTLPPQTWVIAESVRVIPALVPIVSFSTPSTVGGGAPLRLDVSFEAASHLGLHTNDFVLQV
jgi:hypothetical protein